MMTGPLVAHKILMTGKAYGIGIFCMFINNRLCKSTYDFKANES